MSVETLTETLLVSHEEQSWSGHRKRLKDGPSKQKIQKQLTTRREALYFREALYLTPNVSNIHVTSLSKLRLYGSLHTYKRCVGRQSVGPAHQQRCSNVAYARSQVQGPHKHTFVPDETACRCHLTWSAVCKCLFALPTAHKCNHSSDCIIPLHSWLTEWVSESQWWALHTNSIIHTCKREITLHDVSCTDGTTACTLWLGTSPYHGQG